MSYKNIGQRLRELRDARGLTREQLQSRSKVSRSYVWHIENQHCTPSLATVEKISGALEVGLGPFLTPKSDAEILLEDGFTRIAHPFVRQLNHHQRQLLLKTLRAAPRKGAR